MVVRKLRKLVKNNYLSIDSKKHYRLTGVNDKKLFLLQGIVLERLAKFSSKVFNLAIL